MSLGLLLGFASTYYLLRPAFNRGLSPKEERDSVWTAAVIGSMYCAAGVSAIWYPGTHWFDPEYAMTGMTQREGFVLVSCERYRMLGSVEEFADLWIFLLYSKWSSCGWRTTLKPGGSAKQKLLEFDTIGNAINARSFDGRGEFVELEAESTRTSCTTLQTSTDNCQSLNNKRSHLQRPGRINPPGS